MTAVRLNCNAMKIHQLPIGARFEYEGKEYVKTGPMCATGKDGQRLIPKYAVLKSLGSGTAPSAETHGPSLSRERVVAACERFHAACALLVPEERQDELAAAHADFLKALG